MKLPYGFTHDGIGNVAIDEQKANTVRMIYRQYLTGMSLGGIADFLFDQSVPSPMGKERWTQPVISSLLSNAKYIGPMVSFEEFFAVQMEKSKRSLNDEDTGKRKATRYNSKSVLSGLLVCGQCGYHYRRITLPSGEVVWRCANRVEHGHRYCQDSPTISEQRVKESLCKELGLAVYQEEKIKERVERAVVGRDGSREVLIHEQTMEQVFGW